MDQLIDRTARNNLLYYRDLKAGTLDLSQAPEKLVFDILGGRGRSLTALAGDDPEAAADAIRRGRAIRNKAVATFEERGIHTLYLACGMATWDNPKGTATPAAPALLVPATLTPRGASQQEFDLAVTGELEVNPTLLNELGAEFNVECDPEELLGLPGMDGAIDTSEEFEIAFTWLREKAREVPGFEIRTRIVLGNFSYAKLPMVRDLASSVDALTAHDLVAALAGDPDAQQAIRDRHVNVEPSLPDATPPADEFLVLDADSTQSLAINKALAGQDLIIKGPPGTGKSQTITNLIACLVARGKTVLFVAEKRAAIDAVLKRMTQVGLDDLVLDLHGGVSSRRQVARSFSDALQTNSSIALPDLGREHRELEARRTELNAWAAALHDARPPWNISLFEAQRRLLLLGGDAETSVRLRGDVLRALTADCIEAVADDLRRFVSLGGLRAASSSRWAGATITTKPQVDRALALVDLLLGDTLAPILDRLERACAEVGQPLPPSVTDWTGRLQLWGEVRDTLEHFDTAVFDDPVAPVAEKLAPLEMGVGARLSAAMSDGEFRAAHKRAKSLLRDGVKLRRAGLLDAVQAAADQQARWADAGGATAPQSPEDLDELREAHAAAEDQLRELAGLLGVGGLAGARAEVVDRLTALRADTATAGLLPELHELRQRLNAAGLEALVDDLASWHADVAGALATFEHCLYASIVDDILLHDPRTAAFDGIEHGGTVEEFQHADRRHIRTTAQRVRRLAAERARHVEDETPEQATLLRREAAKKSRHRPVREVFGEAPEAMTAVKPCWVMSPLVVSQVLPNDRPYFDYVVFDEASQVRPAEAIPAIARGRHLVVAGDEKQLPPTDFFSGTIIATDDEDDDLLGATSPSFESILDGLEFLLDWQMLSWHYRSQDERLIAFSNTHLYGRSLLTFPGVSGPESIRHVHVPWRADHAAGEDSSNDEVRRVVELVLEHAETRPDDSLGVIAMGIKHADRIDGALRIALAERPDLEDFFDEASPERFFIKNLERRQGDERDSIILTVGYGKNSDGRMLYRFGPLNTEGGERRLNVAVTRARRRMTLVSSFLSADLDPDRTTARGADLLRRYIGYAESNGARLDHDAATAPELNPFELDIRDALERAGVPVICQYGVSGYRIDFAAKHPERPGRLVLAIEADGASYHSSATARDRDRLRQEQLERLGWRFHRIWSQDWFRERQREIERVQAAYRAAVVEGDTEEPEEVPVEPDLEQAPHPAEPPRPQRGPRPNITAWGEIDMFTDNDLRAMVRWIESDTLLRSREALITETMRELGFKRRGKKIVGRIGAAVDAVRSSPAPAPKTEEPKRDVFRVTSGLIDARGNQHMAVKGESFYRAQLDQLTGGGTGDYPLDLLLVREPDNPYDPNCIAVRTADGTQVGNLSREDAGRLAAGLDAVGGAVLVSGRIRRRDQFHSWNVVLDVDYDVLERL